MDEGTKLSEFKKDRLHTEKSQKISERNFEAPSYR